MSDSLRAEVGVPTDVDIDYRYFSCCGNEHLVFLRCSPCGHIWVECLECSNWYVNLDDTSQQVSPSSVQPSCPKCSTPFGHRFYLEAKHANGYLATRRQVLEAGLSRFVLPRP